MFSIWIAFIIGIVEGLTEFLPVSSTGHMIITERLFGYGGDKADTFVIVIQLGAILAVAVLYWKRVLRLFGIGGKQIESARTSRINLLHIAIAIVPVMALAYLFHDKIRDVLFSPETVAIGLVLGGILMIVAEKSKTPVIADRMDEMTYKQAFFVGLWQILSLWPGFSRSGSTIAGGMMAGASRAASADFTFLIAIPVMVVATGYEMLKNYKTLSSDDIGIFAVGFIVSFIVALVAVATFIKLVQKLKLTYFAYYRFVLAAVIVIYMLTVGF